MPGRVMIVASAHRAATSVRICAQPVINVQRVDRASGLVRYFPASAITGLKLADQR
jgi:hypothetical protein